MAEAPLNYLTSAGARADVVLPLTWFVLGASVVSILVVSVVVLLGVRRVAARGGAAATAATPVMQRPEPGVRWIVVSLLVTAVPVLVALVWTMLALARGAIPGRTALALDVTPRQWWWEVRYGAAQPSDVFTTANEIHIPVGVPVRVQLHGRDVIHSFWVPQLAGKTDAIPGQVNVAWLHADRPGRYRGQCAEFCGIQHATMAFEVVADPPAQFERWLSRQRRPAAPPATAPQSRGLAIVESRCALCHTVRGTSAGARAGPDLTHLASRRTIGAGLLHNNRGSLAGWVQSPQGVKPGAWMPDQHLDGPMLLDVVAYLETLR